MEEERLFSTSPHVCILAMHAQPEEEMVETVGV
jgi:hypothetical protein